MKFLVADDHPLFRDALRNALTRLDESAECIDACNCAEAEAVIRQTPDFDLVLLDNVMPCAGGTGVDFVARITDSYPELPVVMLSASENRDDMQRALDNGALGYIPKSLPTEVMISALRLVLSGGIYVPPQMVAGGHLPQARATVREEAFSLSPRQREIGALLCAGYSNKEIGKQLGLSPETVKAHLAVVYRTLGVNNRTLAVLTLRQQVFNQEGH